jgi:hypothetical protein
MQARDSGTEDKEERSLEEWVAVIAKKEADGDAVAEEHLLHDFLEWERLSNSAPSGKWRGANSRKWGKVGIEMRLTGSVPRTEGPVTELGRMICKFVDVVDVQEEHVERGTSGSGATGPSASASNDAAEPVCGCFLFMSVPDCALQFVCSPCFVCSSCSHTLGFAHALRDLRGMDLLSTDSLLSVS